MAASHILALSLSTGIDAARLQQARRLKTLPEPADIDNLVAEEPSLATDLGLNTTTDISYVALAQTSGTWKLTTADTIHVHSLGERAALQRVLDLIRAIAAPELITFDAAFDLAVLRYSCLRLGLPAAPLEEALTSGRHKDAQKLLGYGPYLPVDNLAAICRDINLPDPNLPTIQQSRNRALAPHRDDDFTMRRAEALSLALTQLRYELHAERLTIEDHRTSITVIRAAVETLERQGTFALGTSRLITSP